MLLDSLQAQVVASIPQTTHTQASISTYTGQANTMDTDGMDLYGSLQDDDILEAMEQNYRGIHSQLALTDPPSVQSKGRKAKEC